MTPAEKDLIRPYKHMKSGFKKARRRFYPRCRNLTELDETLMGEVELDDAAKAKVDELLEVDGGCIYKGKVNAGAAGFGLLFINPLVQGKARSSGRLYVDCTFKVAPNGAKQVMTIYRDVDHVVSDFFYKLPVMFDT